jgi:PPM family protein phosphatase
MPDPNPALTLRFAARCDVGAARRSNEEASSTSERMLAVADGGRGPGGAEASAAPIDALKPLELSAASAGDCSPCWSRRSPKPTARCAASPKTITNRSQP